MASQVVIDSAVDHGIDRLALGILEVGVERTLLPPVGPVERGAQGVRADVVARGSTNGMMMSAPRSFWAAMEVSGVDQTLARSR